MGIEHARKARAAQSLEKLIRLDSGAVVTKREFLDRLRAQGGTLVTDRQRQYAAEEKLSHEVARMANRVPIGNPNHPETREYYALRDKLKAGIYKDRLLIRLPTGTFYEVSKTEAEYFEQRHGDMKMSHEDHELDLYMENDRYMWWNVSLRTTPAWDDRVEWRTTVVHVAAATEKEAIAEARRRCRGSGWRIGRTATAVRDRTSPWSRGRSGITMKPSR